MHSRHSKFKLKNASLVETENYSLIKVEGKSGTKDHKTFRFNEIQKIVLAVAIGLSVGFTAHLFITYTAQLIWPSPTETTLKEVDRASRAIELYQHPINVVEQYKQRSPEWCKLTHESIILALLLQYGEDALRSAIIVAFLSGTAVFIGERMKEKSEKLHRSEL